MAKEYTLDEIRRLADTDPAKLAEEYQAARAATANLVDRARAGIAARSSNPPATRFHAWAQGYGERFIYTGRCVRRLGLSRVSLSWMVLSLDVD
jgi:hypothetical protein